MPALSRVGLGAWAFGGVGWGPQDDRDSIATIHHAVARGRQLDRHRRRLRRRPRRADRRRSARRPARRRAAAGLHQGRGPGRPRHRQDPPRPQPGLAAGRVRGLAAAPRGRADRPLPAALAGRGPRRGRSGLVDRSASCARRARSAGPGSATSASTCSSAAPGSGRPTPPSCRSRCSKASSLADRLPWLAEHGVPALVYSPLESGLLSGRFSLERLAALPEDDWRRRRPRFQSPEVERALALVELLRPIAAEAGASAAELAIAWTLHCAGVTGAIVGARAPAQVDGWIGAAHPGARPGRPRGDRRGDRRGRVGGPVSVDRLAPMAGQPTEAEVRAPDETARLREENLRLRDQLIARDAEMGSLRGQVAELEAGAARVMNLYQRVRSLVPAPRLEDPLPPAPPPEARLSAADAPLLGPHARLRHAARRPRGDAEVGPHASPSATGSTCLVDDALARALGRARCSSEAAARGPPLPRPLPRRERRHRRRLQRRPGARRGRVHRPARPRRRPPPRCPGARRTRRSPPTPRPTTSTPTKTRSTRPATTRPPSSSPTGHRSGCAPRCTPATSACCAGRWSRRSAASTPSSRARRTGTWCCRVTERARRVVHVPRVLYHWRTLATSAAGGGEAAKPWAFEAGTRAVQAHCERIGLQAEVGPRPEAPRRLSPRTAPRPRNRKVSIVIPTAGTVREVRYERRGPGRALRREHPRDARPTRTTRSSSSTTPRIDADVLAAPEPSSAATRLRLVEFDEPFNFSEKINRGAVHSDGEHAAAPERRHGGRHPGLDRAAGHVRRTAGDRRGRRQAALGGRPPPARRDPLRERRLPGPHLPRLRRRLERLLEQRPRRPELPRRDRRLPDDPARGLRARSAASATTSR